MNAKENELVTHWVDLLQPLGAVTARAMFGGHGVYVQGTMFALVHEDELYLKVDEETEARFEAEDLPRFVYAKKSGGTMSMSYRKAPTAALDDGDLLVEWGRLGVEAAQRAARAKSGSRPRAASAKAGKASKSAQASKSAKASATPKTPKKTPSKAPSKTPAKAKRR